MATYTVAEQAATKAAETTLATAALSAAQSSMLLVALGYDDAQGHPLSVAWGNRLLRNRPPALTRLPGAIDIGMSLWVLPRVRRISAHVMTATWAGNVDEKAMLVGAVYGKNRVDQASGSNFASATSTPETGVTAALSAADDLAVAYFVSEGPDNNDTFGTMEILDGVTWTAVEGTQRIGTNGPPPVSNVTITAGWLNLTSALPTNARLVGATSRSWTCGIVTLKDALDDRAAVSPSDIHDIEDIFETLSKSAEDATFIYNYVADRMEVFDKADTATALAYWDGGKWVTL